MRINKFLAECGIASRRNCETLVTSGRVKVNGKKITNLATDVDPDKDMVSVDDKKVERIHKHVYIMLNKPKGYLCTTHDEKDRKTVLELVKDKFKDKRLFPVGRLDYDTEGLLLLTTDGDLSNRITHPRHEISKTYVVKIEGEVTENELNKIRAGVVLDGVKTKKCSATIVGVDEENLSGEKKQITRIEVVITEGRNRQVRRMFESINREVVFLKRVAIGQLRLGGLYRGKWRELNQKEIEYVKQM